MGDSWDERQARERAHRAQVAAEFHAIAGAVARALGGTYEGRDDEMHWMQAGAIVLPGEVPVRLHVSRLTPTGKGPRFVASVVLPRDRSGSYIRLSDVVRELPDGRKSSDISLEVTADLAKAPERIAADLLRRLVPDATMATAAVLRVVERRDKFADGVMALARELAPMVGADLSCVDPKDSRAHLHVYSSTIGVHGEVDVYGPDSVTIKLSMTAAQARAVLAAIATVKGRAL